MRTITCVFVACQCSSSWQWQSRTNWDWSQWTTADPPPEEVSGEHEEEEEAEKGWDRRGARWVHWASCPLLFHLSALCQIQSTWLSTLWAAHTALYLSPSPHPPPPSASVTHQGRRPTSPGLLFFWRNLLWHFKVSQKKQSLFCQRSVVKRATDTVLFYLSFVCLLSLS